ncbi:MAG: cytochrome c biogenesis protein CcdA [Dissulfurispiraceae bacterium]|jgi:cytochrome c-type biogenesis protein|nr:cytochrome c biogenesis protein CcdA [Dissulfurispiraceae bacterium]
MKEMFEAFPYAGALMAGIFSFLSPCVLPLVPAYVSYITGMSIEELRKSKGFGARLGKTLSFIAGFSSVFIALGASSSFLGAFLIQYLDQMRIIGGVIVIILGLFVAGFLKLDFLMRERRMQVSSSSAGYIGSFVIGMSFAAGWTPCIGPILGTILIYAGSQASALYGLKLLAVYSLGLAMPFLVTALALNFFLKYIKGLTKYMRGIMIASGIMLIVFGILLLTNQVSRLAAMLPSLGIDF